MNPPAQANVSYVDQFGRPVQPPVGAVQAQPAANVKFVKQSNGYPGTAQRTAATGVQPVQAPLNGYPGTAQQVVVNRNVLRQGAPPADVAVRNRRVSSSVLGS